MADTKDTIYIDVDDEITSIIEKVRASRHKIVALVLPKRAATLQSIVNMKLLRRTATEANKQLVLITSEAGLLPLAGAVGLHVAKNLQSKPGIPAAPDLPSSPVMTVTDPGPEAVEAIDPTKSVGELAGLPATDADETIEVDDPEDTTMTAPAVATEQALPKSKNKKLKIPNFERFRVRLFLGILIVILLAVGWYICFVVLPKAKVTIRTDTSTITSNLNLNVSASAKQLDMAKAIVPADLKEVQKTTTQKVSATGQKDQGTKASGKVTIFNCTKPAPAVTIPAGTGVSANGLTYITQTTLSLDSGNFDGNGNCKPSGSHVGSVIVIAQQNGDQYNLAARSDYAVAGFPSLSATDSTGMTGGATKMVTVVSDADIQTATQKLAANGGTQAATDELKKALQTDGKLPIVDTFLASSPVITSSPNVGAESPDVTVTQVVTYDMVGVNQDDLNKLVKADITKQIDPSKQKIVDTGLAQATFHTQNRSSPGELKVTLQTLVVAGAELIPADLQKEIAGKKSGDAIATIQSRPGVRDVSITYSPFWISTIPKKSARITIVINQNNVQPTNATPTKP